MIDLHTHTIASDGTYTPEDLMAYALTKNLKAIAITDHDTINGLEAAHQYLSKNNISNTSLELINGIELSANLPNYDFDVHILGLFVDPSNAIFKEGLVRIIEDRNRRNHLMLDLIQKAGYNITWKEITDFACDSVITRAHFAKILIQKGYFNTNNEAFNKLLGNGKAAYVRRDNVHAKFAIELIKNAGGIPVIAHPTIYGLDSNGLYALIDELKGYGLVGIESVYTLYSKKQAAAMSHIAKRFDLLETGGSDFHGSNKPGNDLAIGHGNLAVADELLLPLKQYLETFL